MPRKRLALKSLAGYLPFAKAAPGKSDAGGVSGIRGLPGALLRWPALLAGTLAIALIALAVLPWGNSVIASRPFQNVLAMLMQRSPGERATGNLIDTKPALPTSRALGKTAPPRERALGKIFDPADLATPVVEAPFIPPFQPDTLNLAGLPIPVNVGPPEGIGGGGGGIGGGGGGIGGGGGGIGGGGGGGIGGGGGGGGPASPVPAVPEPGTWLLMIVAFGLSGYMLRRQRSALVSQPTCNPA